MPGPADRGLGILMAADRYNDPDPVNLGSGQEVSIKALAELVAREMGYRGTIRWDTSRPNGQPRRAMDTTRARERFGVVAQVPFEQGIRETVAWYRHHAG